MKNKLLKIFLSVLKGFLILSGILFWSISISLIFPIHNIMGWVGLIGIYWMMFGIPLSFMLLIVFLLSILLVILIKKCEKRSDKKC